MAAPTTTDVQNLLTAAGLWNTAYSGLLTGYLNAAIAQFQTDTGRTPLIAQASQTLYFDPPGRTSQQYANTIRGGEKILELSVPFTTITDIKTGYTADYAGDSIDLARQVQFGPDNYAIKGIPIEWIRCDFQLWGPTKSIAITGTPGSFADYPADIFQAIVMKAAGEILTAVIGQLTGGVSSWQEADIKEDYGAGKTMTTMRDIWFKMYTDTVNRWQFFRLGLN